jgi:hypothetical protein
MFVDDNYSSIRIALPEVCVPHQVNASKIT